MIDGRNHLDINVTLILQMLVFGAFVWFTMKFVWPPLSKALDERQAKIADGLAAAERGRREFELAQHRAKDELRQARSQAAELIEKANRRAAQVVDEAKEEARKQAQILAKAAQESIEHEVSQAKLQLQKQVAQLAVVGAEKILARTVDEKASHELLDNLIEEI